MKVNWIPPGLEGLYNLIDDLWSNIGPEEKACLQPETIELCQVIHSLVWHDQKSVPENETGMG